MAVTTDSAIVRSRQCVQCGEHFVTAGHGNAKSTCSAGCKSARHEVMRKRRQSMKPAPPPTKCADCDAELPRYGRGRALKRCEECKAKNFRRLARDFHARNHRPAVPMARQCERCTAEFSTFQPTARFCSENCRVKKQSARCISQSYICCGCGVTFHPKAKDRTKYCSRGCFATSKKEVVRLKQVVKKPPAKHCTQCETSFFPKTSRATLCSRACSLASMRQVSRKRYLDKTAAQVPIEDRICIECNKAFTPSTLQRKKFCSKSCSLRKQRRIARSLRRARMAPNKESLDPFVVFWRDGWKCQICSCATPIQLRGTIEANAPELDHVIPLALGGHHTYDNTQCLCRSCNQSKGDTDPRRDPNRQIGVGPLQSLQCGRDLPTVGRTFAKSQHGQQIGTWAANLQRPS